MPAEQYQHAARDQHRPAHGDADGRRRDSLRLRVSRYSLGVLEVVHAGHDEEEGEADATDPGENRPENHGGAPVWGGVNDTRLRQLIDRATNCRGAACCAPTSTTPGHALDDGGRLLLRARR